MYIYIILTLLHKTDKLKLKVIVLLLLLLLNFWTNSKKPNHCEHLKILHFFFCFFMILKLNILWFVPLSFLSLVEPFVNFKCFNKFAKFCIHDKHNF